MKQKARWVKLAGLLLFVVPTACAALWSVQQASAFSSRMVDDDTAAGALMVSAETTYVKHSDGKVRIWFPDNYGQLTVHYGNFCYGVKHDSIQNGDATLADFDNEKITSFHAYAYNQQGNPIVDKTQYGYERTGTGNCNDDLTFNFHGLKKRQNGRYFVNLDIEYANSHLGALNYFWLTSGTAGALIGLPGDDNGGHQTTQEQVDQPTGNYDYTVKFGTPCSQTGNETATLRLFDVDNGGGAGAQLGGKINIKVRDTTANKLVKFHDNTTTWTPADQDNTVQTKNFTSIPNHKYVLRINNVYTNNVIQYSVPYAQIFSKLCDSDATLDVNATVNGSESNITVPAGTPITFRNWVETYDLHNVSSDKFNFGIYGYSPWGPDDRRLDHSSPMPGDYGAVTFTPPYSNQDQTYCRTTTVNSAPSYVGLPDGASKGVCATVKAPVCSGSLTVTGNGNPLLQLNAGFTMKMKVSTDGYAGIAGSPNTDGVGPFTVRWSSSGPEGSWGPYDVPLSGDEGRTVGYQNPTTVATYGQYTITWNLYKNGQPFFNPAYPCTGTFHAPKRSFFTVTGGDIASQTKIISWNHNSAGGAGPSDHYGASSQLAALAGTSYGIRSFVTGMDYQNHSTLSQTTPQGAGTGLAFGNSGVIPSWGVYGGGYSPSLDTSSPSTAGCTNLPAGGPYNVAVLSGTYCGSGDISLLAAQLPPGRHVTIIRDTGNITIDGNITYGSYNNLEQIPRLDLYASGNIFVNPGVTEIHGVFHADNGNFNTCGNFSDTDMAGAFVQCGQPLKIYGLVSAKTLGLHRTYGDTYGGASATHAPAEEFIYSPEVWLAPGSPTLRYDSYISLPPVL